VKRMPFKARANARLSTEIKVSSHVSRLLATCSIRLSPIYPIAIMPPSHALLPEIDVPVDSILLRFAQPSPLFTLPFPPMAVALLLIPSFWTPVAASPSSPVASLSSRDNASTLR
jgi:hypothetical protein